MQEYGFNATFFVVAGRVDRTYHLTRDYIKKMVGAGMEIGSHGLRHKYLTLMDYGEIERELHQSKSILESITKQPVDYFPSQADVITVRSCSYYLFAVIKVFVHVCKV